MLLRHGKSIVLLLIIAPVFGGQYLVGIPQFIRQRNYALFWGAVITNILLSFLVICVIRKQDRKVKAVILSIAGLSYLLGAGIAFFLIMQGRRF